LFLFVLGFVVSIYGKYGPNDWGDYDAWFQNGYALLQTCGLLLMTIADLDINYHLKSTFAGRLTAFSFYFVCFWFAFATATAPKKYHSNAYWVRWLPALILLYSLVCFIPMIQMRARFFWFTEVFALALALGLVSSGVDDIAIGAQMKEKKHVATEIFIGCLNLVGVAVMFCGYYKWTKGRPTLTTKMNSALVAYLFIVGFKDLLVRTNLNYTRMWGDYIRWWW
jgi:hypothetical protein